LAIQDFISFLLLSNWKSQNVGASMKKFNNAKQLILILDGTLISIYHPTSIRHTNARCKWYVQYKKHHV
jgi:hypothetical protein